MRKFPVTAPSGRQYEVTVSREYLGNRSYYEFNAYLHEETRGWFGRNKIVRKFVGARNVFETSLHNVISIATDIVMSHESLITADERAFSELVAFERWDGVIKPEVAER